MDKKGHQRRAVLTFCAFLTAAISGCADSTVAQLLARAHDGDDMARGELMAMGERESLAGRNAFAVGQVYDPGLFADGDARRAAAFYRSARKTEPKGSHNLAVLVLTGLLSEADAGFAPMTLQQLVISAAEGGVAESMVLAGEFYTLGVKSFPRNDVLATWWFERAVSASGDPWARYRLGEAYLGGKVRSKNQRFAYDLLASAAKAGVPEAASLLASTSTDPIAALRWSLVSARMNGEDARAARARIGTLSPADASRLTTEVAVWLSVHQSSWVLPPRIIRPVV